MHAPGIKKKLPKLIELCLLVLVCLSGLSAYRSADANAFVQDSAQSNSQDLAVSASFTGREPIAPAGPIELQLNRPLDRSKERLSVFIGQADLTGLFTINETTWSYAPTLLPLPEGETEVVVYLVSEANDWKEIARLPLRVSKNQPSGQEQEVAQQAEPQAREQAQDAAGQPAQNGTRFGFEKLDLAPSLTLGIKSQPAESHFPDSNLPARPTFTDFTMQGSFRSDIARRGFNSQTEFDVAGSSFRGDALRFAQLGDAAPRIDLASYLMQFQQSKARFLVGHTSFGASRHLISNFSSRGLTLTLPLPPRFDLSFGAMNGTSIVGFDNFFGISRRRHQILGSALGVEFSRKRPGAARFEIGVLNGWLQPENNFNQANVNDAERSRGFSFRFVASDPAQRLRLDAGFTRSQFVNPSDPLLSQGNDVVPMPVVTRNARYIDGSYDLLKDIALSDAKKVNLTLAFRHERVDPLFRSLGAVTQADHHQNEVQFSGTVGEIAAQFSHLRFNDNLSNIPSILKSLTRRNAFALSVPVASLFGNPAKLLPLLPMLAYNHDRTRQFGAAIPVRGGFELDPASVPDLIATNQTLAADWQIGQWRIGYRINHSLQNNRQVTRQFADLINLVNTFAVAVTPYRSVDLNFDLNIESADNKESRRSDRMSRFAPNINWRMTANATLSATLSATLAGDAAGTSRSRNAEFDLQWSYRFAFERDRFRKAQSQFFIRYANRYARILDNVFGANNLTKLQALNMGLSFTFF